MSVRLAATSRTTNDGRRPGARHHRVERSGMFCFRGGGHQKGISVSPPLRSNRGPARRCVLRAPGNLQDGRQAAHVDTGVIFPRSAV